MTSKPDPADTSPADWPLPEPAEFDLARALHEERVVFWYQPKIDLRKKRLMGLEVFARFCDEEGNVVQGADVISAAPESAVVKLSERALTSALKLSASLLEIGINARFAVNVNVPALFRLPLVELIQQHPGPQGRTATVVFDVTEAEVLGNFERMLKVSRSLGRAGLSIAVDDFGASLLSVAQEAAYEKIEQTFAAIRQLGNIRFAEMKIDRTLVRSCYESADRQKVCEYIIKLTHEFGASAVAVGIERAKDLEVLKRLGCDIGQGYLFGRPMTEDELLVFLWERAARAKAKHQAA